MGCVDRVLSVVKMSEVCRRIGIGIGIGIWDHSKHSKCRYTWCLSIKLGMDPDVRLTVNSTCFGRFSKNKPQDRGNPASLVGGWNVAQLFPRDWHLPICNGVRVLDSVDRVDPNQTLLTFTLLFGTCPRWHWQPRKRTMSPFFQYSYQSWDLRDCFACVASCHMFDVVLPLFLFR